MYSNDGGAQKLLSLNVNVEGASCSRSGVFSAAGSSLPKKFLLLNKNFANWSSVDSRSSTTTNTTTVSSTNRSFNRDGQSGLENAKFYQNQIVSPPNRYYSSSSPFFVASPFEFFDRNNEFIPSSSIMAHTTADELNSNGNHQHYDGMEKELNEDAAWKRIQQNTFTRWANEHLKCVNKHIDNLETDLSDGLLLIELIQVLSHKKLPRHNKKPVVRMQKLENVSMALDFLKSEGIQLVNIDSSDIVDQRLKLILGLIWHLILKYSISMPIWEDDDGAKEVAKETPKQRLMHWIQAKVPDAGVNNFTSDWKDGRALGALVDSCAPGLCPDWPDWAPKNALNNTAQAMDLADNWLGVPKLIEPEEFINPSVDEQSMMTYLSQYPNARLKEGAPIRDRTDPSKVRAYGHGLEPRGLIAKDPTQFFVDVSQAGGKGNLEAVVQQKNGQTEPVRIAYNDQKGIYTVNYTPKVEGPYSIFVLYNGREIPSSPYQVNVESPRADLSKVFANGPGLENGVMVKKPTYFDISAIGAGKGKCEVILLDPNRQEKQLPVRATGPESYRCEYTPQTVGLHSVNVFYDGESVADSPIGVNVVSAHDAGKVRAWGRGLQSKGVRVGDKAWFRILTDGAGDNGNVDVKILDPNDRLVRLADQKRLNDTTYAYFYEPTMPGPYQVHINYEGQKIARSPFEVNVGKRFDSKIRAFGPGLEGGIANLPCDFTVETNGETGSLGFSIEGPSKAQIDCRDNGDGSAEVSYTPTAPGDYAIHILCASEDIPESPFMVEVLPYKDNVKPSMVRCHGAGLQSHGVQKNKKTDFTVDAKGAGDGALKIWGLDREYNPMNIQVRDNHDGTYNCSYTPTKAIRHTILVSYSGVAVAGSPYRIHVDEAIDSSKVRVYGPGVEKGVKSLQPTHFIIDCKQAGPGEVEVELTDDKGSPVDISVLDNADGSFTIKYTAPKPGTYQLRVVFAGSEIPGSPIRVNVQPHLDVGGIRVEGLDGNVLVGSKSDFQVDCRSLPQTASAADRLKCVMREPSGKLVHVPVKDKYDGTYTITYEPNEQGLYSFDVLYDNIPIPTTLSTFAQQGTDPSRCRAEGPGLERGYVDIPNDFVVNTKGAGAGKLNISLEGPSEAKMTCVDQLDGSYLVTYIPTAPGEYVISVRLEQHDIHGSPFNVFVEYPVDHRKVSAWGPGLEADKCRANMPLNFHVDASRSGYAPLNVSVKTDHGSVDRLPEIIERPNNTYDVTYYAPTEGNFCTVHVTHGDKEVANSPYRMKVLPTAEPQKVRISGHDILPLGEVPASVPVSFTVDTTNAGYANLEVIVVGPDDLPYPVKVLDRGDGLYDVTFVPEDVGPYNIVVKYGGQEVPRSPYNIKAYAVGDASKCYIVEGLRETIVINEEYCIIVNSANAGMGKVTCRIIPVNGGIGAPLNVDVSNNKDGTTSIFYTVKQPDEYKVNVKFGGQLIPNGEWLVDAETPENYRDYRKLNLEYDGLTNGHQSLEGLPPVEFWNIQLPGLGRLAAEVKMPSGKTDMPTIKENHDGSVTLKYQPKERGLHEMHILYEGGHVQGSPFQFHVDAIRDGFVTAFGPGLSYGTAGEPATFTVCIRDAGAGQNILDAKGGLSIVIDGPAKADIKCHDNKDGTCSVSWIPPAPGEYKVRVKFADKDIAGSPFIARIAGEGRKRSHISVGSTSEVSLKISEPDVKGLSASIKSPSGIEEPCFIRKLDEGHLGISFTPREVGEHLVAVKKKGTLLPGAPFRIHVGESEVGNASKVKISGNGLENAQTQNYNEFIVDTRNAGFGGLSVSIEGPSKCEILCKENKEGICKIHYKPTEPGIYVLSVKFADHHVPGSPYTIKCAGAGVGTVSEKVQHKRNPASVVLANQECQLCLKIPGASAMDMKAKLINPDGKSEDVEVYDLSDSQFIVKFTPKDMGLHMISVFVKDNHISGSPFQFTVGPFKEGGAHKVRAGGPGLTNGEVNTPVAFNIYTREAGAGNLSVAVEGPSKAKIDFKDHKDGNCYVSYAVSKPGDYVVAIKFDEQHVPDSPFKVYIAPSTGESRKLELACLPDTASGLNKPVTFNVLTHGAKGHLDAKVMAPSGASDDCFITPIDEGESYAVRFIPKETGNHYVHIKLDGTHMRDSPFRVRVGGKEEFDPTAVTAEGAGLKGGETGQKLEYILNTCNAGAGVLAVTIDGPSKATLDAYEVDVGYKVRYTPMAPGDYYMTIKYNGIHIPGSPFKVKITGKSLGGSGYNESSSVQINAVAKTGKGAQAAVSAPKMKGDASKVECKGMGLKRGNAGRQNSFNVDTSKAGQDLLYVAVMTPKGQSDECSLKHTGRGNYVVSYMTRERGTCFVYVKYGDQNVPGSPFPVEV